ncbi:MAG TPA: biotin/lipoyl-containing protein, partial [Acidimicrobiia bacterium]|nr:biotin/lipoyl-containing protein [Acidimicrobiia bacterium]
LVKASAGGGGKGMRLATRPEDLFAAVADAAREAAAAFGDPAVFLERYVSPGRHVEVQVIGDHHGTVVHLFERDCSVQRRHQKLVEEAPSPAVDDDLRARMGQAAVAAAEAVGYHGVGTVEFLLGPDGAFYFLEMNTRLQVEHPVTELVTGLDLVRLQLAVAEGRPLPAEVHGARISGHAVEVRLYAEDPQHDYQPQTGRVEALEFPDVPGLRLDSGVEAGSVVGTDYDSMLAKVIATGPTRVEAVRLLVDALRRARIHGVGTNRDLLLAILDHDEFGAGTADTGFLERHPPEELLTPTLDEPALKLHALAAALAMAAAARAAAPVLRPVRAGFRNNPGPPALRRFTAGDTELTVGYRLGRNPLFTVSAATGGAAPAPAASAGPTPEAAASAGSAVAPPGSAPAGAAADDALPVTLIDARPEAVELLVDGVRRRFDVRLYDAGSAGSSQGSSVHVDSALGSAVFRPVDRFPAKDAQRPSGSLVAPMPGTVVKVMAAPGDAVTKGDPVVVIEAMKMEHTIGAGGDGIVAEVLVEVGRQVDIDQVIAVIKAADEEMPEGAPADG